MRKELRNRIFLIVSLGLACALGVYLIFGENGLLHVHRLKQEKSVLDHQVQKLQDENTRLTDQIKRLETDKEYLETVVRDKLGVIKPDESVIMFKAPSKNENKSK